MHHALAVPTQNGGSHPGGGGVRRLSIDAEPTRVDLVLSAATPIGLLIPPIVDILTRSGGFRAGPLAVHYQLSLPGSTALDPSKTLAQLGIRDGAALLLTSSPTELMVPRFDDEAEAVSASVSVMEWRWTRRRARLVGSLVTTWLAGVAATVLTRAVFHANDAHRTGCAGVAATIALLSLLAAAIAYRVSREQSIGLTLGALATSFAALAGLLAVPGGPGAPNALFAAAAAATCAAAMRVISSYAVAFTALVAFAVTGATAAMVAAITAIPLQAIGAAFTAISLAFVEASAPLSVTLARLSPPTADARRRCAVLQSTSPECQSNPCPCLAYQLDRRLLGLGSIGGDRRSTGTVPDRRATISRPPVRHRSRRRPAIAGSRTPRPCEIRAAHHLWNSHGQHCSRRCCCRVPTMHGPCRRGVVDSGRRRTVPSFNPRHDDGLSDRAAKCRTAGVPRIRRCCAAGRLALRAVWRYT